MWVVNSHCLSSPWVVCVCVGGCQVVSLTHEWLTDNNYPPCFFYVQLVCGCFSICLLVTPSPPCSSVSITHITHRYSYTRLVLLLSSFSKVPPRERFRPRCSCMEVSVHLSPQSPLPLSPADRHRVSWPRFRKLPKKEEVEK